MVTDALSLRAMAVPMLSKIAVHFSWSAASMMRSAACSTNMYCSDVAATSLSYFGTLQGYGCAPLHRYSQSVRLRSPSSALSQMAAALLSCGTLTLGGCARWLRHSHTVRLRSLDSVLSHSSAALARIGILAGCGCAPI